MNEPFHFEPQGPTAVTEEELRSVWILGMCSGDGNVGQSDTGQASMPADELIDRGRGKGERRHGLGEPQRRR